MAPFAVSLQNIWKIVCDDTSTNICKKYLVLDFDQFVKLFWKNSKFSEKIHKTEATIPDNQVYSNFLWS